MSKYIDAERLIAYLEREAEIEFKKTEENANSLVICHFHNGCRMQALDTIDFIKQLQQEQDILVINKKDWEAQEQFRKNKDFGKPLQQEQQEVDLDADIEMEWDSFNKHLAEYGKESEDVVWLNWYSFNELARRFYELGLKAGKEK